MNKLDYFSVPLENIVPNVVLPFKIYLFINNHFILFRHENTEIEEDLYSRLQYKKVKFVFIELNEFEAYKAYIDKSGKLSKEYKEALKSSLGKLHNQIQNDIQREFEHESLEKNIERITDIVSEHAKSLVDELQSKPYSTKLLSQLTSHSHGIYGHCTNVSAIALHLAMKMGFRQQHVLEYIGSAGLLHDIGKIKINRSILKKEMGQYTWDELNRLKEHPIVGRDLLLSAVGAPNELKLIVLQHHEHNDGSGYPQGLKGSKIYEPTKILSIANVFEHLFHQVKVRDQASMKSLIAIMSAHKLSSRFDPHTLEKALKILQEFT